MNYPFWDIDIGYGLLMPAIAVIHVFVAHFAIGGGLYLVMTETMARRRDDLPALEYLQRLSKFFVLVTVVFGALTGVGIWFVIGLLSPTATEALIHNFVWAWATEWTFFVIEITAAILYFYGWQRMSGRNHLILGWIYFGAAWLSLFVINGILSFMLTPGEWLRTGNVWDGFFNPTFLSSLVLRTGVCIMLAGLYSLVVISRNKPSDFRNRTVRYNAAWGLLGLVIAVPSFLWYHSEIPAQLIATVSESMTMPAAAVSQVYWYSGAIAVALLLFGLVLPRWCHTAVAIPVLVLSLLWFGAFEWFRESVRKPYVITDYIYANAVELNQLEALTTDGMLKHITYRTDDDGADLFRHACRSCHTIDCYRPLKPAFDGTDQEFIAAMVRGVTVIKGNMPPFVGTYEESELIAAHLYSRLDHRSISEIYGLSGRALGATVYEIRCGGCHVLGGWNDKTESLAGLDDEDYGDILDMAGELGEEMPDFTGDDEERSALIEFLKTLEEGGVQ